MTRHGDYVDPRLEKAIEKAVQLLVQHMDEWQSTVEAYWLVRRHEDEIGFPLTYNMIEEAVEKAKQFIHRSRVAVAAEA